MDYLFTKSLLKDVNNETICEQDISKLNLVTKECLRKVLNINADDDYLKTSQNKWRINTQRQGMYAIFTSIKHDNYRFVITFYFDTANPDGDVLKTSKIIGMQRLDISHIAFKDQSDLSKATIHIKHNEEMGVESFKVVYTLGLKDLTLDDDYNYGNKTTFTRYSFEHHEESLSLNLELYTNIDKGIPDTLWNHNVINPDKEFIIKNELFFAMLNTYADFPAVRDLFAYINFDNISKIDSFKDIYSLFIDNETSSSTENKLILISMLII